MARFEEEVNIRAQQTATGAVPGALSLAQRLEAFQETQRRLVTTTTLLGAIRKTAVERGEAEARETGIERGAGTDVTKPPKLKEKKFIGNVEIEAHNKALRAAYIASLTNDVKRNVERIKAENPDNLVAFNESVGSFAKGVINGVDPSVRDVVIGLLDERITSGRVTVQAAEVKKQNDIASQELQEAAEAAMDGAILAARSGEIETSAKELIDLNAIIDSQVEAGFLTEPEAREKKREAELRATQESLIGTVRKLTEAGKFAEALTAVEKAREKAPSGMSVEEHEDLISGMVADINTSLNIRNTIEAEEDKVRQAGQLTKYNDLFIGIIDGTAGWAEVRAQLKDRGITQSQGSSLVNVLDNRGAGIDDWPLIGSIQEAIRDSADPAAIRNDIINNSGSRLTEETAVGLINDLNQSLDTESVLNTSEVKRARDFIVSSIRVTGPLGGFDTEAERRLARSVREYDERVLDGESAFDVADELVGKDEFQRAPPPILGDKVFGKDQLDEAQQEMSEALLSGQMNKEDYNFQVGLIDKLRALKSNIDAFDAAKKEVGSGQ